MRKVTVMVLTGALLTAGCSEEEQEAAPKQETEESSVFEELEETYDARLGVYAWDTGSGETVAYRADERFAYTSTHKALAVGALLKEKSIGELEEEIFFTEDELVNYNPITEMKVDEGMTLRELSDASIRYSDNTAGNLILEAIGGPEGFKEILREIGDDVTEPARVEPELNDVKPGEMQDTSTARALAESLETFTLGGELEEEKAELMIDWLRHNTTGDALIRAGVPDGWMVGDKTGAGPYGTRNDIAVIWPPDADPILLAVLSSRDEEDAEYDDQLIADATERALEQLKNKENGGLH